MLFVAVSFSFSCVLTSLSSSPFFRISFYFQHVLCVLLQHRLMRRTVWQPKIDPDPVTKFALQTWTFCSLFPESSFAFTTRLLSFSYSCYSCWCWRRLLHHWLLASLSSWSCITRHLEMEFLSLSYSFFFLLLSITWKCLPAQSPLSFCSWIEHGNREVN